MKSPPIVLERINPSHYREIASCGLTVSTFLDKWLVH